MLQDSKDGKSNWEKLLTEIFRFTITMTRRQIVSVGGGMAVDVMLKK